MTIEEYSAVRKVGTRIEDRRLDHADDLRMCLAFDAITAWRVMDLERLARDKPDMQAREVFPPKKIRILYDRLRHAKIIRAPPAKSPEIRTFVVDLALLAGFPPHQTPTAARKPENM